MVEEKSVIKHFRRLASSYIFFEKLRRAYHFLGVRCVLLVAIIRLLLLLGYYYYQMPLLGIPRLERREEFPNKHASVAQKKLYQDHPPTMYFLLSSQPNVASQSHQLLRGNSWREDGYRIWEMTLICLITALPVISMFVKVEDKEIPSFSEK